MTILRSIKWGLRCTQVTGYLVCSLLFCRKPIRKWLLLSSINFSSTDGSSSTNWFWAFLSTYSPSWWRLKICFLCSSRSKLQWATRTTLTTMVNAISNKCRAARRIWSSKTVSSMISWARLPTDLRNTKRKAKRTSLNLGWNEFPRFSNLQRRKTSGKSSPGRI